MKYLKIITAICLIGSGMLSCQKEIAGVARPGNTPDSTSSGLLKKTVSTNLTDNLDWLTIEYEYDSSQDISTITTTQKIKQGNGSIVTKKGTTHFFRDNTGRVIRIGSMPDTSSLNTYFKYENTNSQYPVSAVITLNQAPGPAKLLDSAVFEYDANNRVIKATQYLQAPGNTIQINTYQQNVYDPNGNIIEKKIFEDNDHDGIFQLNMQYKWEYENSNNPKYQNETAFFHWNNIWPYDSSPNNVIRQFNYYPGGGPDDEVGYSFQYDNTGKVSSVKKAGDADNETKYYYY